MRLRFATFPDYLDSKNIGEDVKERIPLYTDALPIWHAFHRYVHVCGVLINW